MKDINSQPAVSWNPAEARMSFFTKPITNKRPCAKPLSLFETYRLITTPRYRYETEKLRAITDEENARQFKGTHLDYVTPSGVFSYCSDTSLVNHSQLLCIDFDHLDGRLEEMKELLLKDSYFQTLLLFRSPRGVGLKWFIHIDLSECDHRTWFAAVRNYLISTYQLNDKQVDKQCGNPSRPCFLCYDPEAYLLTDLIAFF